MINDQHVGEVSTGNLTSQLDPDLQAFIDELTQQSFAVVAAPARLASPWPPSLQRLRGCWGTAVPMGPWCGALKGKGSWRSPGCNLCWLMMIWENPWKSYPILWWSWWEIPLLTCFSSFDVGYLLETSTYLNLFDRDLETSFSFCVLDVT